MSSPPAPTPAAPRTRHAPVWSFALAGAILAVVGCRGNDPARRLTLADFQRPPGDVAPSSDPRASAGPDAPPATRPDAEPAGEPGRPAPSRFDAPDPDLDGLWTAEGEPGRDGEGGDDAWGAPVRVDPSPAGVFDVRELTADAMIGQVNGEAIFASDVLAQMPELPALAQRLPTAEFREQAIRLVATRLRQIVADALILGEAERALSDAERAGLRQMVNERREQLLRRWGQGAPAAADAALRQRTGVGLDRTLAEFRDTVIVQNHLRNTLLPRINITRKDIERYYATHRDRYQPPPLRTLRLIRATREVDAQAIRQRLADGESFEDVASSPANRYKPDQAGLFGNRIEGETPFGFDPLNEALAKLDVGQTSEMLQFNGGWWWLHLDEVERRPGQSLRDVQLEIEQRLRRQRFGQLSEAYRRELFQTGSYRPIEDMASALLDVVMSRYAVR